MVIAYRLRVTILILSLLGMMALGASLILHAQSQSAIDAAQEVHFRFDDKRLDDLEKDRNGIMSEVSANADRIAHDEGIGIGLFAAIGILQSIGLIRQGGGAK